MKIQHELTIQQARNIQLATMGLLNSSEKVVTKKSVLQTIKNMSVLQIDTIHVVNKSPYLVLYSRLGVFEKEWLTDLLKDKNIFEYWSHAACFLPIGDYPLYKSFIDNKSPRDFSAYNTWLLEHEDVVDKITKYIKKHGAVKSSTFKNTDKKRGGWWNWKTEKIALEGLFLTGIIAVSERKNFQRVYDLTSRVIPKEYRKKVPLTKVYEEFIERSVKHLGVTKKEWVPDYFRLKKTVAYPVFQKLLKKKEFIEVKVEGFDQSLYAHKDNEDLIKSALKEKLIPTLTTFLSPFDPLIWDRFRAKELFGFEYQIESYTPSHKRKYGYFTLPVLYRGAIIGRMDAKAHRKEKIFEVKALHFEEGFKPDKECLSEIAHALKDFATWHKASKITVQKVFPEKFKSLLLHQLRHQEGVV